MQTLFLVFGLRAFASPAVAVTVTGIKCEYRSDPLGVDVAQPRLVSVLCPSEGGKRRTACLVLATSGRALLDAVQGDMSDMDRIAADSALHITYPGQPPLPPGPPRCVCLD